jgi:pimeloyl-ACP methyl ester carboxylesterase
MVVRTMYLLFATPRTDWGLIKIGRFCLVALFMSVVSSAAANAQAGAAPSGGLASPAVMVFGFVGGFVRSDDDRHLEVQMINRIAKDSPGVDAVVFENRHTAMAREEILHRLDTNGDGRLSDGEKRSARIILVGHSWGGSAAIRLAKELNESGIPVLLTIQLDSVNRGSGDDCIIPANVAQALNFYQTRGLVHGCRTLRPVDASRTRILGNFGFEYTAQPADCSSYSWFNRHVLKDHNAMDCDPKVWSQVEREIRTQVRNVDRIQQESGAIVDERGRNPNQNTDHHVFPASLSVRQGRVPN